MEVGVQSVRVLIGNTCGFQIDLHHLGRLPLFQQREQRVRVVEMADPWMASNYRLLRSIETPKQ